MLKNLRPARHGVLEVSPARVKKPCTASADRLTSNQPIKSIRGVGFYGGFASACGRLFGDPREAHATGTVRKLFR